MSLIFGRWNFDGKSVHHDLNLMSQELDHWNPDNKGLWEEGGLGLGHHHLINTPESQHEKQPYCHSHTQTIITADARIDNRKYLLKSFDISVEYSNKTSDDQLILEAYLKWGIDCTSHLLGDFAFVIWDDQKKRLFCARDHLGCKPFFYKLLTRSNFTFASHLRGLLPVSGKILNPNYSFIASTLTAIIPDRKDTCYVEIKRLPPAHSIVVTQDKFKIQKYWQPDSSKRTKLSNDADYLEAFTEKLESAITRRSRSLFPIGVQLSGGLDSSGIAAMVQKTCMHKPQSVIAFTHGISEYGRRFYPHIKDEVLFAKRVAEYTGIEQHVIVTDDLSDYGELAQKQVELNGGVTGFNFTESSYLIGKAATAHGIRTMFSGFPGDEGVTTHCSNLLPYLSRNFRVRNHITELYRLFGLDPRMYLRLVKGILHEIAEHYYPKEKSTPKKSTLRKTMVNMEWLSLHPNIEKELRTAEMFRPDRANFSFSEDLWGRILSDWLPMRMETENTASLAWKTETVYPLADIELLDFFASIPISQKMRKGVSRWIFRQSMEGLLPKEIQWRKDKQYSPLPAVFALMRKGEGHLKNIIEKSEKMNYNVPFVDYQKLRSTLHESIYSYERARGMGAMMAAFQVLITFEKL